jgi:hypothetical protein
MKLILIAALFFLGCGSSNKGLNASDVNMRELGNELYGDEDVTFKGLIKSGKTKKGTLFERNTEHHLYAFKDGGLRLVSLETGVSIECE